MIDVLSADRALAILRYPDGGDLIAAVTSLAEGGIRVLELTVDTPGAWDAIGRASAAGLVAGAGTVTAVDEVKRAHDVGARFVVSPGFDPDVVAAALDLGLEPLPGVATGTEILAARRAGVTLFKLFPAGALGLPYLAQLRGPFRDVAFVPTGGVGITDAGAWLDAGATAVAVGSALAGRSAPVTGADRAALTSRAEQLLAVTRGAPA